MISRFADTEDTWLARLRTENPVYWKKYLSKLSADIDTLSNGRFFFDNPWDMECVHTPYNLVRGKYDISPNGDPEWVFQFCRLEWISKFILHYKMSGDNASLRWWCDFVDRFFKYNNSRNNALKVGRPTLIRRCLSRLNRTYYKGAFHSHYPTYRTLDTSIRNYSLLLCIAVTPELEDYPEIRAIKDRVSSDNEFTYANLRDFDKTSNWGIIIVSNYICCRLLLDSDGKGMDEAFRKLRGMLDAQLYSGGGHVENSNMYHNQVLLSLLRVVYWMTRLELECPDFIVEAARKMSAYTKFMTGPDGRQVMYGDSDDTELSTLNYIADSILYDRAAPPLQKPDLLLFMEFGVNRRKDGEIMNEPMLTNDTAVCFDDGVVKMASGDMTVMVYNSLYHSSHKHTDNGSFVLYYKNAPFIVDSGRYTYHDAYWREYFKSAVCHNVVTVCEPRIVPGVSDSYNRMISDAEIRCKEMDSAKSVYLSYKVEELGCFIERRFRLYADNVLVIVDRIACKTPKKAFHYLSIHPDVAVDERQFKLSDGCNNLYMSTTYEQIELTDGFVAPDYNEKVKASKLEMFSNCSREVKNCTIFSCEPLNDDKKALLFKESFEAE